MAIHTRGFFDDRHGRNVASDEMKSYMLLEERQDLRFFRKEMIIWNSAAHNGIAINYDYFDKITSDDGSVVVHPNDRWGVNLLKEANEHFRKLNYDLQEIYETFCRMLVNSRGTVDSIRKQFLFTADFLICLFDWASKIRYESEAVMPDIPQSNRYTTTKQEPIKKQIKKGPQEMFVAALKGTDMKNAKYYEEFLKKIDETMDGKFKELPAWERAFWKKQANAMAKYQAKKNRG